MLTRELTDRAAAVFEHARRRCMVRAAAGGIPARAADAAPSCGGQEFERELEHSRRLVRLRDPATRRCCRTARSSRWPADLYLEGLGSASRLVPQLAARGHRHARPRAVRSGADARVCRRRAGPQDVEVARQHHRAAGRDAAERRRRTAPVGVDGRLPRGHPPREGNPRARRRGLPKVPQRHPCARWGTSTTSIPAKTMVPRAQMLEIDRWAMARYAVGRREDDPGLR